ncbi:hypothetical protein B0O99DRAFT_692000 [Bisporella sp. PMI_857]|nr:hypothetical protein B0O99DRAFT_692000 [Bisporella sp. PMI_857]
MSDALQIHDVLIIGAGPCGLAIAARLREPTPSALFTDSEHQRYHWMKASTTRRTTKPMPQSRRPTALDRLCAGFTCGLSGIGENGDGGTDICVLDASGDKWMSAWDSRFERLRIGHLRSPMFFHPEWVGSPRDGNGMLEFTYQQERKRELIEIKGVVGKGLSKYQRKKAGKRGNWHKQEIAYLDERARPDYYRPSQPLFHSYCTTIATRYHLSNLVQHSTVTSISYSQTSELFTIRTTTGKRIARIVIYAAGVPPSPPPFPFSLPSIIAQKGSISHAFSPNLLPPSLKAKLSHKLRTNVLVIGGGLTSGQVSVLLANNGVKVWHLMRGSLKCKHFDLDLSWVGKYKNFQLASFWGAEGDEERAEMILTPEYKKLLLKLVEEGNIELKENTKVSSASWDGNSQTWSIKTEPEAEIPKIDHVIYATGSKFDVMDIDALKPLMENFPVDAVGGMPCLNNDLMWRDDVPFFITGRLAGLRIGPGAGNLEGARQGSERIAWKVGELLNEWEGNGSGYRSESSRDKDRKEEIDTRRVGLGMENQFGILAV